MVGAEKVSFFPGVRGDVPVAMSQEQEVDVLREIEEEVKKLLGERRSISRGKAVIYYFSLKQDGELGEVLKAMEKGDVVLISFEGSDLGNVKEKASALARKMSEIGGEAYFIRWPVLLLVRRHNIELNVHK